MQYHNSSLGTLSLEPSPVSLLTLGSHHVSVLDSTLAYSPDSDVLDFSDSDTSDHLGVDFAVLDIGAMIGFRPALEIG